MRPLLLLAVLLWACGARAAPGFKSFPAQAQNLETADVQLTTEGRQFARDAVVDTVLAAAAAVVDSGHRMVIADVGKDGGGTFFPHATHRDGRTVDILMPVVDDAGRPTSFPHDAAARFGYCARFDEHGRYQGTRFEGKPLPGSKKGDPPPCPDVVDPRQVRVDFAAVARFVRAIDDAAKTRGLRVKRVIVAPEYVDAVFKAGVKTEPGQGLGALQKTFVRRAVWVRHDEHMHIELEPR